MTWSRIHSAPLRVLPKPRPASSSQVRQSPFGACWLGRPHQPQSCSIASSSRSLVCFRNAASCSGGSDASNSIYTFWKYFRNAFARDAGLRIDHLLLSPSLATRLVAAGVDREGLRRRGRAKRQDDFSPTSPIRAL